MAAGLTWHANSPDAVATGPKLRFLMYRQRNTRFAAPTVSEEVAGLEARLKALEDLFIGSEQDVDND
jgi:hypothetical protein